MWVVMKQFFSQFHCICIRIVIKSLFLYTTRKNVTEKIKQSVFVLSPHWHIHSQILRPF